MDIHVGIYLLCTCRSYRNETACLGTYSRHVLHNSLPRVSPQGTIWALQPTTSNYRGRTRRTFWLASCALISSLLCQTFLGRPEQLFIYFLAYNLSTLL